jgi:hypothetical protein
MGIWFFFLIFSQFGGFFLEVRRARIGQVDGSRAEKKQGRTIIIRITRLEDRALHEYIDEQRLKMLAIKNSRFQSGYLQMGTLKFALVNISSGAGYGII